MSDGRSCVECGRATPDAERYCYLHAHLEWVDGGKLLRPSGVDATAEQAPRTGSIVVVAVAAGVVAVSSWLLVAINSTDAVPYLAAGVGWFVGSSVAVSAGPRRGPAAGLLAVVVTLLSLTVAQYLIERHLAGAPDLWVGAAEAVDLVTGAFGEHWELGLAWVASLLGAARAGLRPSQPAVYRRPEPARHSRRPARI